MFKINLIAILAKVNLTLNKILVKKKKITKLMTKKTYFRMTRKNNITMHKINFNKIKN